MNRWLWRPLMIPAYVMLVAAIVYASFNSAHWWFVGYVAVWAGSIAAQGALFPPRRRGGHISSPAPYRELPRVPARPAAGALSPRHPDIRVIDRRSGAEDAERQAAIRRAFGIVTAEEAMRNLMRNLGVPEPLPRPFELAAPCPRCGEFGTHLLGDRDTTTYSTESGTVGPSIGRECLACGHTWKERLDA